MSKMRVPKPTQADLPTTGTISARAFDCIHYDRCLAAVCRTAWLSWSCGKCSLKPARIVGAFIGDANVRLCEIFDVDPDVWAARMSGEKETKAQARKSLKRHGGSFALIGEN